MSTLWIREFPNARGGAGGHALQMPHEPGTDQTPVTFSTSAASAAFAGGTRFIGFIADAAFHYVIAAAPVATTSHLKVPANTLVFVGVAPGQKIAVIAAA